MLGLRPFDVQLIGAMILHNGEIAEMRTGEGQNAGRCVACLPQRPLWQGCPGMLSAKRPRPCLLCSLFSAGHGCASCGLAQKAASLTFLTVLGALTGLLHIRAA